MSAPKVGFLINFGGRGTTWLIAMFACFIFFAKNTQSQNVGRVSIEADRTKGEIGSLVIQGCDYWGPSISGTTDIYICEQKQLHDVREGADQGAVAAQTLRRKGNNDERRLLDGPIRQFTLHDSRQDAIEALSDIGDRIPGGLEDVEIDIAEGAESGAAGSAPAAESAPRMTTTFRTVDLEVDFGVTRGDPPVRSSDLGDEWTWELRSDQLDDQIELFVLGGESSCRMQTTPQAFIAKYNLEVDAPPLALEDFGCKQIEIETPRFEGELGSGSPCVKQFSMLRCFVYSDETKITVEFPGWRSISVPIPANDIARITAADLQPILPFDPNAQIFNKNSYEACAPASWKLSVKGYCDGDESNNCAPNDLSGLPLETVGGEWRGPTLEDAGWPEGAEMPSHVQVVFSRGVDAANEKFSQIVKLDQDFLDATDFIPVDENNRLLPLKVEAFGNKRLESLYRLDRKLMLFEDKNCQRKIEGSELRLTLTGARDVQAPSCGFYQVFDKIRAGRNEKKDDPARVFANGRPRSKCSQLTLSPANDAMIAQPEIFDCGEKRLFIVIVENKSLQKSFQRIRDSVNALIRESSRRAIADPKNCDPIHLVRTDGLRREVILTGEDLAAPGYLEKILTMKPFQFQNSQSEVFGDLDWIARQWPGEFGGAIIIADASLPAPTSQIDAPAAILWWAEKKFRKVLTPTGDKGCAEFQDIHKLPCEPMPESFSVEKLVEIVDTGLAHKNFDR